VAVVGTPLAGERDSLCVGVAGGGHPYLKAVAQWLEQQKIPFADTSPEDRAEGMRVTD
jgi:hypothetical protein